MADGQPDGEETERITYQFETDGDVWKEWTSTIPRRQPIHSRLRTLIEQDLRAARRDAGSDINEKTVNVFATRIRIRSLHAQSALEDDEDIEAALDQLDELIDIADTLES